MLEEKLKLAIKSYPNFPIEGIVFKDLLPILENPSLFSELIKTMSCSEIIKAADVLVGIDARGFIFASSIALIMKKPFIVARKPNKLPGELIQRSYSLEYGNNSLSIQKDALLKFQKFAIIDDLLATGGTVNCIVRILKDFEKQITGLSVVAELINLNARKNIDFPIESQVKIN